MTRQITDIVKAASEMTREELMDRLKTIRRNKYTTKPAAQKIKQKDVTKKVKTVLQGLDKETLLRLLAEEDAKK